MTENYLFSTLTKAIKEKSPLRVYLDMTFPNRRSVNSRFRASSGPLLVPGQGANPGTMGTAFDNTVRLRLAPQKVPFPVLHGTGKLMGAGGIGLVGDLSLLAASSREDLARVAWVFALFTDAFRYPAVLPAALEEALESRIDDADSFMELASQDIVDELLQLDDVANAELYPHLTKPVTVGPIFQGLPIAADADLIHDGTLIELKATLGRTIRGIRQDELKTESLLQLVAYALIDTEDTFSISSLALYSARYGNFERWDLAGLLQELAGRPVDLIEERQRVQELIKGN